MCVDWDGVLVDPQSQNWLPGAEAGLRALLAEYRKVIIHTSRANWEEGRTQVEAKLAETLSSAWLAQLGNRLQVVSKPLAAVYLDDRAVRFTDWSSAIREVREMAA